MKYLLIVLAILMLGCGTDTEIVEEPTPIEEALTPVKEEPLPIVEEPSPIPEDHGGPIVPRILGSNVLLEDQREVGAFDPVPLNRDGIFFDFANHLIQFEIDLSLDEKSLDWIARAIPPEEGIGFSIKLAPPAVGPFLEHDKEYRIEVFAVSETGDHLEQLITFRTIRKP